MVDEKYLTINLFYHILPVYSNNILIDNTSKRATNINKNLKLKKKKTFYILKFNL